MAEPRVRYMIRWYSPYVWAFSPLTIRNLSPLQNNALQVVFYKSVTEVDHGAPFYSGL
ncbi:unnamed protein product [Cylicocyclus nassatus]|uniref:Uncharacterized protein n=1 Tax=Cylicocyclus nassatus TaxID=53992 RepID=A0AA36HGK9_CYLNA|nr:unnamed protein product [Cylicocyclus nassatus]